MIYVNSRLVFNKNFYAYMYPNVSDPSSFSRFSGLPRKISRFGFNAGEIDIAGIGFENHKLILQIGRGRQSWSAGNNIGIALSEESYGYDYGLFGLKLDNFRARYMHGFLENDSSNYNRYITSRGIEWTNNSSLVIGLSEVVIYSGESRPFDFAYLNPISSHLEIELNNRQNKLGVSSGNAVWQGSIDCMLNDKSRFSINLLADELVFDQSEIDSGLTHGLGFSLKGVYSPSFDGRIINIYSTYVTIGTNTFRHGIGSNNFVQRSLPIGYNLGSDFDLVNLGLNFTT